MNQPGENQIEQCNRATTKQRATKPNHHNSKAPQATTAIKHNLTPQPNRRTKTGSSKRLRNHHIRSCARSRRKLSALSYSEIKIDRIVPKRSPPCTTRHKIQLLQWPHNPNQPKYSAGSWFFLRPSPSRHHENTTRTLPRLPLDSTTHSCRLESTVHGSPRIGACSSPPHTNSLALGPSTIRFIFPSCRFIFPSCFNFAQQESWSEIMISRWPDTSSINLSW